MDKLNAFIRSNRKQVFDLFDEISVGIWPSRAHTHLFTHLYRVLFSATLTLGRRACVAST